MAAVDLAPPAVAHFDLAVAGRSPIANDEVISEPILHPPDMPMVIIEDARVALARAAIMDNNKLPATPLRPARGGFDSMTDLVEITITVARPRPRPGPETESARRRRWRRLERPGLLSKPDFSITIWARSSAGTARGIFDCGDAVGVGDGNSRAVAAERTFRWNAGLLWSRRWDFSQRFGVSLA